MSQSDKGSGTSRRDLVIKVKVNPSEKAEIIRQKARMSFSGFLRERGLNQGHVYDPTYAAIGGIYQSAGNLRDSATEMRGASTALKNVAANLTDCIAPADCRESTLAACQELRALAMVLKAHGERIEEQANEVAEEARALSRKHMSEMLKRYPAKEIKPRDRR